MIKTYSQLRRHTTFESRFEYLRLDGVVGKSTFGYDRYLNQLLYKSSRWRRARDIVIIRDEGCDLGIAERQITDKIIIHHMNPITIEDIEMNADEIFDPELLVCTSANTHQAIHYSDSSLLVLLPVERTRYDTCPWKNKGG